MKKHLSFLIVLLISTNCFSMHARLQALMQNSFNYIKPAFTVKNCLKSLPILAAIGGLSCSMIYGEQLLETRGLSEEKLVDYYYPTQTILVKSSFTQKGLGTKKRNLTKNNFFTSSYVALGSLIATYFTWTH